MEKKTEFFFVSQLRLTKRGGVETGITYCATQFNKQNENLLTIMQ